MPKSSDAIERTHTIIDRHPYLSYDSVSKIIVVDNVELSNSVIGVIIGLVEQLRYTNSHCEFATETSIRDIKLHYYDQCLLQYCHQILDEGMNHKDTCWVKKAEENISLGKSEEKITDFSKYLVENRNFYPDACGFVESNKKAINKMAQDEEGWVFLKHLLPFDNSQTQRLIRLLKLYLHKLNLGKKDRILDVVSNIREHGWDSNLAWIPQGSVLGVSRSSNKYMALTGRHRIAAALYLHSKNNLQDDFCFSFPVISFPWGAIRTSRPFPGDKLCDLCQA